MWMWWREVGEHVSSKLNSLNINNGNCIVEEYLPINKSISCVMFCRILIAVATSSLWNFDVLQCALCSPWNKAVNMFHFITVHVYKAYTTENAQGCTNCTLDMNYSLTMVKLISVDNVWLLPFNYIITPSPKFQLHTTSDQTRVLVKLANLHKKTNPFIV
jgi:hypothetical protein